MRDLDELLADLRLAQMPTGVVLCRAETTLWCCYAFTYLYRGGCFKD